MATKKSSKATAVPMKTTAALANGTGAAGARYLREGFAFEPAHDLEFALGYPHFRVFVDDHPDDARAAEVAKATFQGVNGLTGRTWWPREVAMRVARAGASDLVWIHRWTEDADRVVSKAGPIDSAEARSMLAAILRRSEALNPAAFEVLFIVEAQLGPDVVAEIVVSELEQIERAPHFGSTLVQQLGFVLLRVSASAEASLRKRLEAVFARWALAAFGTTDLAPPDPNELGHALRSLDMALHGRAGCERSLWRVQEGLDLGGTQHVNDDRAYVEEIVLQEARHPSAMRFFPDVRFVFVGGPKVVEHYEKRLSTFKLAADQAFVVETFGRVRHENVVRMMLTMSATSKVKPAALAWLRDHHAYATPILEKIEKSSTPQAAWAAAALAKMR